MQYIKPIDNKANNKRVSILRYSNEPQFKDKNKSQFLYTFNNLTDIDNNIIAKFSTIKI